MEVLYLKSKDEKQAVNIIVSIFPSEAKADELTKKMNKNMINRKRYTKHIIQYQHRIKKKKFPR